MKAFVGNLPWSFSSEDLTSLFTQFGEVDSASVIKDRVSGRSRGFGFVAMTSSRHLTKAISELDGATVGGREIRVSMARARAAKSEAESV